MMSVLMERRRAEGSVTEGDEATIDLVHDLQSMADYEEDQARLRSRA